MKGKGNMRRNIYTILFTVIIASIFIGCTETPLFYTIENETEVEDGSLDNTITFTNLGTFDSNYVGAGKKLWYRPTSGGSWSKLSLPSGYDGTNAGVSSMIIIGATLYVSVYTSPQASSAIYSKASIAAGWNQLVDNADKDSRTGYSIYRLFDSGGGFLYINRLEYLIYDEFGHEEIIASKLFSGTLTNATIVNVNNKTDLGNGFIKGMISNALIYNEFTDSKLQGTLCTRISAQDYDIDATSPESDENYFAIGEGNSYIFLSVKDTDGTNPLYYKIGGVWTQLTGLPEDDALISSFCYINDLVTNTFIVGTTDYVSSSSLYYADGYYQIDTTSTPTISDNSFSDSSNYTTTDDDLRYATINQFYFDTTGTDTLFALTQGHGVWQNKLSGTSRIWVWE